MLVIDEKSVLGLKHWLVYLKPKSSRVRAKKLENIHTERINSENLDF